MMTRLARLPGPQVERLKAVLFIVCLYPLAALIVRGFTDDLGANPIEVITRHLGTWTINFLLITLAVTPLRRLSGWQWVVRLRRMFGLYAFFYALLHFVTYIWLDQFFDLESMLKDVMKRPFITIGALSFLLLIPLAVTSTNNMVRRLGGKRWQLLHRLAYATAIGGVVHYLWLVKKDITQPLLYTVILIALLGMRVMFSLQKARVATLTRPEAQRA
jgi:methionine sulfoxide reductase heme-binding subunit